MTDTEQKALAASKGRCFQTEAGKIAWCNGYQSALQDHEAELHEQAERFSEVAAKVCDWIEVIGQKVGYHFTTQIEDALSPFILPEPEPGPLVEAAQEILERHGFNKDGRGAEYALVMDALNRGYKIERIEQ